MKTHYIQSSQNGGFEKSPFQAFLIEFLESFASQNYLDSMPIEAKEEGEEEAMQLDPGPQASNSSLDDLCSHVARLFGELQRCGIFSHDNYVRYERMEGEGGVKK